MPVPAAADTPVKRMESISSKGFLQKDNGKTNFYFKDGMLWERGIDGADNLWRTSLAYIAWGDPALKDGMIKCTRWVKPNRIQYYRTTYHDDQDVSRDQVTMFLAAMAIMGEDVKPYIKATKWKLSERHTLTPDMWLWMKALGGSKIARKLFYLMEIPLTKLNYFWNKSKLSRHIYPGYAAHLLAWQMYALNHTSNHSMALSSTLLKIIDKDNYLVQLLLGYEVSADKINGVKPMTDFVWQRYKSSTKSHLRPLTSEEAEYNTLDVDVLNAIYNRERCKQAD